MKNGKFSRRGVATKTLVLVLTVMMIVGVSVGGTLAWLTAKSGPVTNTFSVGDITIELDENVKTGFKVVPGASETKDPYVTVQKGSEKCYVYVSVANGLLINGKSVVTWNIDSAKWEEMGTATKDGAIVTLYRYKEVVDAADADKVLPVFTKVTYDGEAITKDNIAGLKDKTIVIDAFAHQSENITNRSVADNEAYIWAGVTAPTA